MADDHSGFGIKGDDCTMTREAWARAQNGGASVHVLARRGAHVVRCYTCNLETPPMPRATAVAERDAHTCA